VIVAGYWQLQAEGKAFGKKARLYKDAGYDGSGLAYNKVSFRHALENLITKFPDRQFVIVEDVPVGPELEPARLLHLREVLGAVDDRWSMIRFGISRPRYEKQLASYRSILQSVTRLPNVSIVRLISKLCDDNFCHGMRDGVSLFRNSDHLSASGGMLFADTFTHVFAQRVGAAR
jgi:hypothetical protein